MLDKILFRCDAGYKSELGSGHLIRSITIAKELNKKYLIKKKNILFLLKTNNKYSLGAKIIKSENFRFQSINSSILDYSDEELNEILKINFKVIVFDRMGKINLSFIKKIKKLKKKIICIDDSSKNKFLCDLSINPLVYKNTYSKRSHMSGFKFNILPSNPYKKMKARSLQIKKVFFSFGGFDSKNYSKLYLKLLEKEHKYKIINSKIRYKKMFESRSKFYKKMQSSDLVICSGGITMFDAINMNKIVISVDQYKHQLINIKRLVKDNILIYLSKKNSSSIFSLIDSLNNPNKLNLIYDKIRIFNMRQKSELVIKKIFNLYAK